MRNRTNHGFATFMATAMIVLIAAALVAMTALFVADAQRTKLERSQAELRQMLLAGAQMVKLNEPSGQVSLPQEYTSRGGALRWDTEPSGQVGRKVLIITATLGEYSAVQQMTLQRDQQVWRATETEILRQF